MIAFSSQHLWLIPTVALLCVIIAPPASVSGEAAYQTVTDPTTQLSFVFPSTFHLTRYQDNPMLQPAQREALPRVLVLAEHTLHQGHTPIAIGSIPTISIDVLTGPRAEFNQVFLRPEFRKTIGQRIVYELPAHRGPIHQQVFCYLVPLSADRIIEIAGHRDYFTAGQSNKLSQPTRYDDVIAGIIASRTLSNL